MMNAKSALIGLLLLGAAAQSATAQAPAREDGLTVLRLAESAERAVRQDRLRAQLRVVATGSNAARVQAEANQKMTDALARVRAVAGVRAETAGYHVYEEQTGPNLRRWRAEQGLSLVGAEAPALLALVGELQESGLLVNGLSFELAPETARGFEAELTAEALQRLRERAQRVAQDMNLTVVRFREIRVGGGGRPPPAPRMDMARMALAAAPPVAEAGESTVRISVEADVLLGPRGGR